MRKLFYVSAAILAFSALSGFNSVAQDAPAAPSSAEMKAARPAAPAVQQAAQAGGLPVNAQPAAAPAAPTMSSSGHAVHDNAGIGTHGDHPEHGKLHGHPHVGACMKHCDQHHAAHQGTPEQVAACKKLCHEHHKVHQVTNPTGRKGAGAAK
ncbi:MAG: hypothetical protein J0G29_02725 [Alphaproteobacteria bacterium]|nr:hypothetical protein [Alphaproteobacteria bacterium]OJV45192.1 MAG: hypothetical protein BGO28_00100 [Alphaproteobacteria bacterium 43-37]